LRRPLSFLQQIHPARMRLQGMVIAAFFFFFLSGACGLVYQVVWTRKLVLLFGTTAYAVSTVLSIFFLGLGVGSFLGGRVADRAKRPLAIYGLFEIAIGLWALFFIAFIGWGEGIVVALLRHFSAGYAAGIALRAALAVVFLMIPVVLMGATLPLLARFAAASPGSLARKTGALYAVNTLGAVAGCAAAGFFLLPALGYAKATWLAAAVNVVVGLLAWSMSRTFPTLAAAQVLPDDAAGGHVADPSRRPAAALVMTAFGVSGFCGLALEVLWTRLLVNVFIGTTYAFTTMLTTFLCGIAVGGAVAAARVERCKRPVLALGVVEFLFGVTCLSTLFLFPYLPEWLQYLRKSGAHDWEHIVRAKFVLAFVVLFPPTFFSGMTFPLAVRAYVSSRSRAGRGVGSLYAANTLGGVLGALAGGFLLVPRFGTHDGIVALACLLGLAGAALVAGCPASRPTARAATALAGIVLFAAAMSRLPDNVDRALTKGYVPEDNVVIHYREGVEGTVVVSGPEEGAAGSDRVLYINSVQATASIEKGVKMNRFQGALPFLFDRDPKRVLFMCFGSGVTAGMLAQFDVDRIDAVEISRDVLEAAPLFSKDNLDVARNPRLRFIIDDGRNYLLTSQHFYDVITFEPMPLALAGVSTFYTREFYRLCLSRLNPGGLVSQWVPLHSLDPDNVRALVYTFAQAFPDYCAWYINADLFLIGSNQPLGMEYGLVEKRLGKGVIAHALQQAGLPDVPEVLACFFMTRANIDRYVSGRPVRLLTDDLPWAEFTAPRLMYEQTVQDSLRELRPFLESPTRLLRFAGFEETAEALRADLDQRHRARAIDLEGLVFYYGGMMGGGADSLFMKALDIDSDDAMARYYLREIANTKGQLFLRWAQFDEGEAYLKDVMRYLPGEPSLYLALGDIYAGADKKDEARRLYASYGILANDPAKAEARIASLQESEAPNR